MIEYQTLTLFIKFAVFLVCAWGWTKSNRSLFAWGAVISFILLF